MVWVGELGRNLGSRYKVNPFAEPGRSPSKFRAEPRNAVPWEAAHAAKNRVS